MHLKLFIIPDYLDTDAPICIHIYDRPFVITVVISVGAFIDSKNQYVICNIAC